MNVLTPLPKIRADLRNRSFGRFMRARGNDDTTLTESLTVVLVEPTTCEKEKK